MDKNKHQKLTTEEALNPRQDYGRVRLSLLSPGSLVEMGDSRRYSSYQQATLNGQPKKSNTDNERSHLLNNECCNKYCISMYNTASAGARPMLSSSPNQKTKVHDFPEWRTIRSLVLWYEILSESIQHMHLVSHQPVYKSSFFLDLRDNWNQWKLLKRKSTHKNPHSDKEAADFSFQDKPAVTMTKSSKYLMKNLNNFLGKKLSRQRTYPILID